MTTFHKPSANETKPPEPDDGVKRDRYGRYVLPPPDAPRAKEVSWTRATTFCKIAADTYLINKWNQRMVTLGLASDPGLLAEARATDPDDRRALNDLAERAHAAAGSRDRAKLGTLLHSITEGVDSGSGEPVPAEHRPDIDSYVAATQRFGLEPVLIERIVVVPEFQVAGTFDRVFRATKPYQPRLTGMVPPILEGDLFVGDLKTGSTMRYGWAEAAIQLALYANATAYWTPPDVDSDGVIIPGFYTRMPPVRKDVAVILHLPAGEANCQVYDLDIRAGWEAANLCRDVRDWRTRSDLSNLRRP